MDGNGNLKPEYDAAHVLLGGKWRMPTKAECQELIDNCTSVWTTVNGVKGSLFTSKKNGSSIFLPAAGGGYYDSLYSFDSDGDYWSSTFSGGNYAWYLYCSSGSVSTGDNYHLTGFSVRPVSE